MFYSSSETTGHIVNLSRTDPRHMASSIKTEKSAETPERAFGDLLLNVFDQVNDLQVKPQQLAQQMITDPESVNVHDITIAMAEASMALSMTKSVVDNAIKAYKEIIGTR